MNLYLNHLSKIIIFLSLLLTVSMKSFLNMWILMEINLISFLLWQFSINDQISMIKYFLIQSFFSVLMLLNYLILFIMQNHHIHILVFIFILFSKLGTPPVYLWFINFCASSKLTNLFMASTVQKIIPMMFIFNFNFSMSLMWFLMNILISIWGMHRTVYMKPLLAFSSMFNMIWMFLSLNNFYLMMVFLTLYSLILFTLISMLMNNMKTEIFSDLFMNPSNKSMILLKFLIITSLMGMPPFTGFMSKILMIENFIQNSNYNIFILWSLMFANMWIIFVYLRMIFLTLTLSNNYLLISNKMLPHKISLMVILNIFPLILFL